MQFSHHKAIYLQIVDLICDKILDGTYNDGDKIPSVRELAQNLSVNPNTVARTYERLQSLHIIESRRGLGLFVKTDALKNARSYLKTNFIEFDLPIIIKTMRMLDIEVDELAEYIKKRGISVKTEKIH